MADEKPSSKTYAFPSLTLLCPPRLRDESAKAYSTFKIYYEMGDNRSIPELVKKCSFSLVSLYKWAKKFRWEIRIEGAYYEALGSFRRATEKANERYIAQETRQRLEISAGNHKIALTMQAKTLEILNAIKVLETVGTRTSADGKTIHVTVKPAEGIRLGDAARLALAANAVMQQATALIVPRVGATGKHGTALDGTPLPDPGLAPPEVVLFLDTGDGKPQPLSMLPPPDQVDPYFNPFDGTSSPPTAADAMG